MFKGGERVRSRFGLNYTILLVLPNHYYECRREVDGAIKTLHESDLRKLEIKAAQ